MTDDLRRAQPDTAAELAASLADLRLGDLVFVARRHGTAVRSGYLVGVHQPSEESDLEPATVTLLEVTHGGVSVTTGIDATGPAADPCAACGAMRRGHWATRTLTVPITDVIDVYPSTRAATRGIVARKLVAALVCRNKIDDRWTTLARWALDIASSTRDESEVLR